MPGAFNNGCVVALGGNMGGRRGRVVGGTAWLARLKVHITRCVWCRTLSAERYRGEKEKQGHSP